MAQRVKAVAAEADDLSWIPGTHMRRGRTSSSIVVDTHVKRISKKLGLTKEEEPGKVEQDLMKALPKEHWILWNIQLITLGREICKAPTPKCGECFLTGYCQDYKKRKGKSG